ncbi:uncharacterized protein LOC109838490 [Asparagus officinalis]|uniref:uncharacterized protein LOC109838490 n=1 Tax=Asparagus officinalis TaxID=4686 RepID=UPI00098DE6C3|nr:uncharacterized protein LOC109838490 [Asparagus officinalis]
MNWSFWNVRGLNKSSKQHLVRHHLMQYKLTFIALLETKLKAVKIPAAAKKIAGRWNWFSNANISTKARILLLWDSNILDVQIESFTDQHVTCKVKSIDGRVDCMISSVYGQNNLMNRKDLRSSLNQIHLNIGNKPWLLCGDFNAITSDEEKLGGAALTESDTMDFRDFIEECQLTHLKTESCYFTWNNKQDSTSRVWSRLDRALINDCWLNMHNSSHIEFLLPSFSDHSPGLVSIYDDCVQGKKPFKFFKMWTKHENFLPTVTSVWNTKITGFAMFSVYSKLKLLKNALKELNKRHFNNISEQVIRSKQALQDAQKILQIDPLNQSLIDQERKCTVSYNKLLDCEISFYQQKSRILWSLQGDRCTSYFHSVIKSKRHQNRVMVLYNNAGEKLTDGEEIIFELISFYKSLMGSTTDTVKPDKKLLAMALV